MNEQTEGREARMKAALDNLNKPKSARTGGNKDEKVHYDAYRALVQAGERTRLRKKYRVQMPYKNVRHA